jgi:hypothetical protein
MNKFDGLDPLGWVTQMEHYFSLHGITDDLHKLNMWGSYIWMLNVGSGGNGIGRLIKATLPRPSLCKYFMLVLSVTLTIWDA